MKKFISVAIAFVLMISLNAFAFAAESSAVKRPLSKDEIINSEAFLAYVEEAKIALEAQQSETSAPSPRAPAPPVTHMNVYAVVSPYGGQEIYGFNSNPISTSYDHYGDWIQCISFQIGYDSSHSGQLSGYPMQEEWCEMLDLNGDRVIDAFAYSWVVENYSDGGQFRATSRSINSPWNTMETWINVR